MRGTLLVDNIDVYEAFGVFVVEGGYNELVAFPAMKSVASNDWWEEDGQEFDLSAPTLASHEFSMKFAFHGASRFGGFIKLLSDTSYHTFEFNEIGKTYRLRMIANSLLHTNNGLGLFTLSFADDFPLEGYTYSPPDSNMVRQYGYDIDGVSLSSYGVYLLRGSEAAIQKSPAVKKNLTVDINSKFGVIYDGEHVSFQTKEVKLHCLMRAKSMPEFWQNYNAFLHDLIQPNERMFYVDSIGVEYPCVYKNCSVVTFSPKNKIWMQFDITLIFNSFRVPDNEVLLASEILELIITEDGEFAIDLSRSNI